MVAPFLFFGKPYLFYLSAEGVLLKKPGTTLFLGSHSPLSSAGY